LKVVLNTMTSNPTAIKKYAKNIKISTISDWFTQSSTFLSFIIDYNSFSLTAISLITYIEEFLILIRFLTLCLTWPHRKLNLFLKDALDIDPTGNLTRFWKML
jgi:hypothetical protein